jgi:hypothetical protein
MKPFTQLLRAFPVPDPKSKKKKGGRRGFGGRQRDKSPAEEQRAEMKEIKAKLGPDAWPWFGPMLILDCETTTGIGQELRFGMFQERGVNFRELAKTYGSMARRRANIWINCDRRDCSTIQRHAAPPKSRQCKPFVARTAFAF